MRISIAAMDLGRRHYVPAQHFLPRFVPLSKSVSTDSRTASHAGPSSSAAFGSRQRLEVGA